jgi:hypothetical protein
MATKKTGCGGRKDRERGKVRRHRVRSSSEAFRARYVCVFRVEVVVAVAKGASYHDDDDEWTVMDRFKWYVLDPIQCLYESETLSSSSSPVARGFTRIPLSVKVVTLSADVMPDRRESRQGWETDGRSGYRHHSLSHTHTHTHSLRSLQGVQQWCIEEEVLGKENERSVCLLTLVVCESTPKGGCRWGGCSPARGGFWLYSVHWVMRKS